MSGLDSGSNPLGAHVRDLPFTLTAEEAIRYARSGMPYSLRVPLNHGVSTVRVVVYDYRADRIGRVDVSLQ